MSVRVVSLKFKAEDLQGIAPAQLYRVGIIWVNKQRTQSIKSRALRLEPTLTIGCRKQQHCSCTIIASCGLIE